MNIIDKLRKMPDSKKNTFAIVAAFFLTLIVSVSWFAFSPKKPDNVWDVKSIFKDVPVASLQESLQKSEDNFNVLKNQIFGTTTSTTTNITQASTTEINATTSTTTINNQK